MFSRFARPSSISTPVIRSAILRFCSGVRPSTQVICTCGIASSPREKITQRRILSHAPLIFVRIESVPRSLLRRDQRMKFFCPGVICPNEPIPSRSASMLACFAAEFVERYSRYASHVDADRRQGSPGAHAQGQPLVERPALRKLSRPYHFADALRRPRARIVV